MDRTSTFLVVYAIAALVVIASAAGLLTVMRLRASEDRAASLAPPGMTERDWLLRAQTDASLHDVRQLRRRIAETRWKIRLAEKKTPAASPTTPAPAPDNDLQDPAETLRLGLRDCPDMFREERIDLNARLARWDRLSDVERLALCDDVQDVLEQELRDLDAELRYGSHFSRLRREARNPDAPQEETP